MSSATPGFIDPSVVRSVTLGSKSTFGLRSVPTPIENVTPSSPNALAIVPDAPFENDYCGTCTACLDACPTDAFPKPGVLDANRCISYLTIERRGKPIPPALQSGILDWIFGCDICQEVCPWNRFAPSDSLPEFAPRAEIKSTRLVDLLALDEAGFERLFAGTPLFRTGREAIVRNAAVVAGNVRSLECRKALQQLTADASPLLREAAQQALQKM